MANLDKAKVILIKNLNNAAGIHAKKDRTTLLDYFRRNHRKYWILIFRSIILDPNPLVLDLFRYEVKRYYFEYARDAPNS
jgi:hypothetical protein